MDSNLLSHQRLKRLDRLVKGIAILAIGVGCFVLLGWIFNVDTMKTLLPELASMKVNTAISFTLLGFGLLFVRQNPALTQILALVILILSLLSLSQYILGWNLGIDELFIKDTANLSPTPGRMSFITGLLFFV